MKLFALSLLLMSPAAFAISPVPEPSSMALFAAAAVGGGIVAGIRRRRK
jgi:hypothetical protein